MLSVRWDVDPTTQVGPTVESEEIFRVNRPGRYRARLWDYRAWERIPPALRPVAVELPGHGFLQLDGEN